MDRETDRAPTRRQVVATGAGLVASGLLAGCSESGAETDEPTASATATGMATATAAADTASPTPHSTPETPYTASLAPAGEVTFETEPETVFTVMEPHAEMALVLGRGDAVNAVYAPGYVDSLLNVFTPELDGVSVDWADLPRSWNASKETVYELDSDVHLADPARMYTMDNWDQADIAEIHEEVAPVLGNTFSAQHATPPDPYAGDYEYYTLWDIFGRIADVFREGERYSRLRAIRDDVVATIEEDLPPEEERPTVAMILPSTSDDSMWAYMVSEPGYFAAHTRPLGVEDAMASTGIDNGGQVDYETLLEADPDVLVVLGGVVDSHDMTAIRENLADDPVASQVTAVDEGRVYAQGTRHQGPLVNLFQLEMGAKQLYPDRFGEWPTYEEGDYPDIASEAQLFDRQRVADLINGDY